MMMISAVLFDLLQPCSPYMCACVLECIFYPSNPDIGSHMPNKRVVWHNGRFQSAAGGVPVWASTDSCYACEAGVLLGRQQM